jgi:hypothetical protein
MEWLKMVLRGNGYEIKETPNPLIVGAMKSGQMNRVVQYLPGPGIISIRTPFVMATSGFGVNKEIAQEVESANRDSFTDTFYRDADGDVWASSYIFITDHISGADVIRFLDQGMVASIGEIQKSGLAKHLKR